MSDLASQLALTRTPTHLPLSWYFDPEVAEVERKLLFERGGDGFGKLPERLRLAFFGHERGPGRPGAALRTDQRRRPWWYLVHRILLDGHHRLQVIRGDDFTHDLTRLEAASRLRSELGRDHQPVDRTVKR